MSTSIDEIMVKFKEVNNKLDYSKFEYKGPNYKSTVICPEHGEFLTTYKNIINSRSKVICSYCYKDRIREKNKNKFLESMKHKFPELDFSKFEYIDEKVKSIVICKVHGELRLTPSRLKNSKYGCQYCSNKKILEPLKELEKVHPDYSFPDFVYINNSTKYKVICPKHGEFYMRYQHLVKGSGCKKCGKESAAKILSRDKLFSKDKAITIMSKKFPHIDFSNFDYKGKHSSSIARCKIHNISFNTKYSIVMDKRSVCICPNCRNSGQSFKEKEIVDYIKSIYSGSVIENNRSIILNEHTNNYLEIDIYLPDINLAIEFNGSYWHSDEFISQRTNNVFKTAKEYHDYKTLKCKEKDINLIHIEEMEYIKNKEKILNYIKSIII